MRVSSTTGGTGEDVAAAVLARAFALPGHLAAKADPVLVDGDERQFAHVATSLEQSVADLSDRLRGPARFRLDLCLGHMVAADDPETGLRRTVRPQEP